MKKVMFLMAVAGMFSFAACNNAATEEEVADTVIAEEMVEETVEEVVDSADVAVEEAVEAVVAE